MGVFMFGETIFVAEVLRKNALKAYYDNSLMVNHDEHVTTGIWKRKKIIKYKQEAACKILKSYY